MAIPNRFGENDSNVAQRVGGESSLISWVMAKVSRAREVRDCEYEDRWKEYTRMWRGIFTAKDKNSNSERSRIIAPAIQQAVDMTVSEIEEAVFGRIAWFDIKDDLRDQNKEDVIAYRDQLLEDFELSGAKQGISQTFLTGTIYGTGISKLNLAVKNVIKQTPEGLVKARKVMVLVEPIRPDEFIIDPSARSIEDALFVAHEMIKPIHGIKEKQAEKVYRPGPIGPWSGEERTDTTGTENQRTNGLDEGALILEYFGKVPANMLKGGEDATGMVEAIVVIANEGVLLKAIPSPYTQKDRPIVAYQHDTIPGEFWGRGVCEKGYNPQKALDAELRARMDSLALVTAPMMGMDITRMPKNADLRVRPGKIFPTRGRPSEILEPVGYNPQGLALTFQQSGDLERMVQMGTGAMDSATPIGQNRRNETASGMSMMQSGFIKRSKRTMQNIERQYLDKLIKKALWRYMQFDPQRYPADVDFIVHSTMGIMAKEVENNQLIQMLGYTPPESKAHGVVLQALFENAVSSEKTALHQAIQAMNEPPSEEQQQEEKQMKELQLQLATAEAAKEAALAKKAEADAMLAFAKMKYELVKADLEDDKVEISAANAAIAAEHIRQGDRNIAKDVAKIRADLALGKIKLKETSTNGQGNSGTGQS